MNERGRRATSIEELRAIRSRFSAAESVARGLTYNASPTDVFIATYPKCGTTWLQQILHCLRTRGDADFKEITAVVPWLEMADAMGLDPTAPQRAAPKVFKTHLPFERIPQGGRYVHMVRSPEDVVVSMYHFHEGWMFDPGAIDLEEYALEQFMLGGRGGNYWQFQASWWPHRHDSNVLYLVYEHALANPSQAIARIAAFAGITLDDELLSLTELRSGIEYMKAHSHQFDDNLFRAVTDPQYGLPVDSASSKVREGKAGAGKTRLSAKVREALAERWAEELGERFGLADYAALMDRLLSESA